VDRTDRLDDDETPALSRLNTRPLIGGEAALPDREEARRRADY